MENLRTIATHVPHDKLTRAGYSKLQFCTYLLVPFSVGMFPHLFQHWLTARSATYLPVAPVEIPSGEVRGTPWLDPSICDVLLALPTNIQELPCFSPRAGAHPPPLWTEFVDPSLFS